MSSRTASVRVGLLLILGVVGAVRVAEREQAARALAHPVPC